MDLQCKICNVNFTSEYLLSRHQNRKIPCGTIFKCERCYRILSSNHALEKHRNKKIPCKPPTTTINYIKPEKSTKLKKEIELEIQKEKARQKEIDIAFKLRKKEIELEIQKEKKILLEQKVEKKRVEKEEEDAKKMVIALDIQKEKLLKIREDRRIREAEREALELEVRRDGMREFEREQLKIQLAAEKTKQIEIKAQMQRDKVRELKERKDLEYSRAYQRSRDYKDNIKLYAENDKKRIELQKEADIEILKAKTEATKSIELMKNERKEQTPQIINNNVTINNINICINHIKEHHMDKLNIDFKDMQKSAMEYFKQNTVDCDENKSARFLLNIFNSNDTCNGIMNHILQIAYNNIEHDDKRCVWYMKDPEYYFAGSIENNEKTVKLLDFDRDLFPLFKRMLSTMLIKITAAAEKYVKMSCDYENEKNQDNFIKHKNLLYYQRNVLPFTESLKDIKRMSDSVFEIEPPSTLPIVV